MTPELWRKVESLFAEASELPPERRKEFLDRCCPDESVRRDVESLLRYAGADARPLDTIVDGVAAILPPAQDFARRRDLAGRTLGPYRIINLIGQGGMGEIYAAEDPRLGRQVALKLLPSSETRDAERLRRFQREARAASALNHPNIVTIYDLGEADGIDYIATELVQGRTIRQIISSGERLPVAETVAIGMQITAALAAAHAAGIVHRDIKPENVMVRHDGYVKVLDFGLAKLREARTPTGAESLTLTRPGIVMGTLRYMSPEQARGLETDGRSDIFSLGVVLYEMLSRQAPFTGETASDVLAAILRQEPEPINRIVAVPAPLEAIVRKCLRKDASQRYQSAVSLQADLQNFKRELDSAETLPVRMDPVRSLLLTRRRAILGWGVAVAGAGGLGAIGYELLKPKSPIAPDHLRITTFVTSSDIDNAAVSPDGRYVAYTLSSRGSHGLRVKQLVSGSNEIVIEGSHSVLHPSYSPDGTYLYYVTQAGGQLGLYRQLALGGNPQLLMKGADGPAAVSPDGQQMVVRRYNDQHVCFLVLARSDGSAARDLASSRDEYAFLSYQWAPDGKSILYHSGRKFPEGNKSYLGELELDGSHGKIVSPPSSPPMVEVRWIGRNEVFAIYPDPDAGHQIWYVPLTGGKSRRLTRDSNDYRTLSPTADGKTILAVQTTSTYSLFSAELAPKSARTGPITTGVGAYRSVLLLPDGRIVYSLATGGKTDLWLLPKQGGPGQQLTLTGNVRSQPTLSPDGRYLAFCGKDALWLLELEGRGLKRLRTSTFFMSPTFSPDGRWLYHEVAAGDEKGMWRIPPEGGEAVRCDLPDRVVFSADGKFMAALRYDSPHPSIEIRPADGGAVVRKVHLHSLKLGITLNWMGEDSFILSQLHGGTPGIYRLPANGDPEFPLLLVNDEDITGSSVSQDGKQVVYAAGRSVSSLVMLQSYS